MTDKRGGFDDLSQEKKDNLLEAIWDFVVDSGNVSGFVDTLGLDPDEWDEEEVKSAVDDFFENHVG